MLQLRKAADTTSFTNGRNEDLADLCRGGDVFPEEAAFAQ
jgi:hypothetical protein